MPTKHTLKILVGLQIAALLGTALAAALSIPHLVADYHLPRHVVSAGPEVFWLGNILTAALLVAAVGLCFFADISRTLYGVLALGLFVIYTFRPSVSSGPMDVLHEADAVLRGVIVALVYFSPLSDLYKPRDRGDVRSAQRLLRYLILAQIPLMLAAFGAVFVSYIAHPELRGISDSFDHGHPGSGVVVGATVAAFLIANVCLFVFWKGARTTYLLVTLVSVLESDYLGPSFTPPWAGVFYSSLTMLNGIILGLTYFSPLRELFGGDPGLEPLAQTPPAPVIPPVAAQLVTPLAMTAAPVVAQSGPQTSAAAAGGGMRARFCGECGTQVGDSKFCPACGQRQRSQDECAGCGAKLPAGSRFCAECGLQTA